MAKTDKNIEQVFKNGFQDFEHNVSSKVWVNLDNELFSSGLVNSSVSMLIFL